jgi:organic hydroperoxide reductase OsmC/OhrA
MNREVVHTARVHGAGTNSEQLFGAGWSACFELCNAESWTQRTRSARIPKLRPANVDVAIHAVTS